MSSGLLPDRNCHLSEAQDIILPKVSGRDPNLISALWVLLFLTGRLSQCVKYHSTVIDRICQSNSEITISTYVNHTVEE